MRIHSVLFLVFISQISFFAAGATKSLEIGMIEMDKDFQGGGGCSIQDKQEKFIFADEYSPTTAIMRINGKRMVGKIQTLSRPLSSHSKKGEQFTSIYEFGDNRVSLKSIVASVCPPESESCEVTTYKVDMIVTQGAITKTISGLTAYCGS